LPSLKSMIEEDWMAREQVPVEGILSIRGGDGMSLFLGQGSS
jgi:hypothetical protein